MTINHISKWRMLDNQLWQRRADRILITASFVVLLAGFAVVAFIWAHPVL
jgi:hypothetical protein